MAQTSFDPSKVCAQYTNTQWNMKEDYYTKESTGIIIPEGPTPLDVQNCAIKLDKLLTIARLDYAHVKQMYEKYAMMLKIEEKRLVWDMKTNPPPQCANLKLTVDDIKGLVTTHINTTKFNNSSFTLYELVQTSMTRTIFMEGVIKILQDKKDLLITHSGMLKIESTINGMTPSIPTNTQYQSVAGQDDNYGGYYETI